MSFKFFIFSLLIFSTSCSNSFKLVPSAFSKHKENPEKTGKIFIEQNYDLIEGVSIEKVDSNSLSTDLILNDNEKSLKKSFSFSSYTSYTSFTLNNNILKNIPTKKLIHLFNTAKNSHSINFDENAGNFWGDLIKEFFIGLLIGIIIILVVAGIIIYGSPEFIYWLLIILGCIVALYILALIIAWIVLKIKGEI